MISKYHASRSKHLREVVLPGDCCVVDWDAHLNRSPSANAPTNVDSLAVSARSCVASFGNILVLGKDKQGFLFKVRVHVRRDETKNSLDD